MLISCCYVIVVIIKVVDLLIYYHMTQCKQSLSILKFMKSFADPTLIQHFLSPTILMTWKLLKVKNFQDSIFKSHWRSWDQWNSTNETYSNAFWETSSDFFIKTWRSLFWRWILHSFSCECMWHEISVLSVYWLLCKVQQLVRFTCNSI